jgi:ABC-type multidrug transport system fused ATPase/permease subunit
VNKSIQNNSFKTFRVVLKHLPSKSKKQLWLLFLGMVVLAGLETAGAGAMALFASAIADPEKVLRSSYIFRLNDIIKCQALTHVQGMLVFLSITVVGIITLNNIARGLVTYFSGLFGSTMSSYLGEKLLSCFLYLPYEWHLSKNSADLALAINWRVHFIYFINSNLNVASSCLVMLVLLGSVFFIAPIISLSVAVVIGSCFYLIFGQISRHIDKTAGQLKYYRQSINKQAHKSLHGIKDAKVYNLEEIFIEDYRSQAYTEARFRAIQQTLSQLPSWFIEIVGIAMLSSSVCILYILLESSTVRTTGVIALLAVTAWRVLPAARRIMSSLAEIRASMPFIHNILNYLTEFENAGVNKMYGQNTMNEFGFKQGITLENITFSYKDANDYALTDVNFTIAKGDTIGIVGVSGAGKSTLIDMIIGLLSPTSGKIKIDGKDLTPQMTAAWMHKIGYVPQAPYLCDGTLAENVAFGLKGDSVDRDHVLECCKMAAIEDFLWELPNGIDTLIGERGVKLSGGQRQRVAIARALYHKPEILIFDEATSSLDTKSEKAIQKTIYDFKGKQTLIIIAHRLSTVEGCDVLVWLEKGKVKKNGPPFEILDQYREKMQTDKVTKIENN